MQIPYYYAATTQNIPLGIIRAPYFAWLKLITSLILLQVNKAKPNALNTLHPLSRCSSIKIVQWVEHYCSQKMRDAQVGSVFNPYSTKNSILSASVKAYSVLVYVQFLYLSSILLLLLSYQLKLQFCLQPLYFDLLMFRLTQFHGHLIIYVHNLFLTETHPVDLA